MKMKKVLLFGMVLLIGLSSCFMGIPGTGEQELVEIYFDDVHSRGVLLPTILPRPAKFEVSFTPTGSNPHAAIDYTLTQSGGSFAVFPGDWNVSVVAKNANDKVLSQGTAQTTLADWNNRISITLVSALYRESSGKIEYGQSWEGNFTPQITITLIDLLDENNEFPPVTLIIEEENFDEAQLGNVVVRYSHDEILNTSNLESIGSLPSSDYTLKIVTGNQEYDRFYLLKIYDDLNSSNILEPLEVRTQSTGGRLALGSPGVGSRFYDGRFFEVDVTPNTGFFFSHFVFGNNTPVNSYAINDIYGAGVGAGIRRIVFSSGESQLRGVFKRPVVVELEEVYYENGNGQPLNNGEGGVQFVVIDDGEYDYEYSEGYAEFPNESLSFSGEKNIYRFEVTDEYDNWWVYGYGIPLNGYVVDEFGEPVNGDFYDHWGTGVDFEFYEPGVYYIVVEAQDWDSTGEYYIEFYGSTGFGMLY